MTPAQRKERRLQIQKDRLDLMQKELGAPSIRWIHDHIAESEPEPVSLSAIRHYHKGRREATAEYFEQLSRTFGVRLHFLVLGEAPVLEGGKPVADSSGDAALTWPEVYRRSLPKSLAGAANHPGCYGAFWFALDMLVLSFPEKEELTDADWLELGAFVAGPVVRLFDYFGVDNRDDWTKKSLFTSVTLAFQAIGNALPDPRTGTPRAELLKRFRAESQGGR